jgi:serine/threonine-protein kinase PknK
MDVPRIAAHMAITRMKLGIDDGLPLPPTSVADIGPAAMLAELVEEVRIRRSIARGGADAMDGCDMAKARLERLEGTRRAYARLDAQLLLAVCLVATDHADEARPVLATAVETCERAGLVRPIFDAGPQIRDVVATL